MSDEIVPIIAKIDNPIVQGHYVRKLADALAVSEATIEESLVKYAATGGFVVRQKPGDEETKPSLSRLEKAEAYLLAMLLQGKTTELFRECLAAVSVSEFRYMPVRRILEQLVKYATDHRIVLAKDFADALPQELLPTFDEAFLWDVASLLGDDTRFRREWEKAIREVKRSHIRKDMEDISRLMHDQNTPQSHYDALQEKLKGATDVLTALEKGA